MASSDGGTFLAQAAQPAPANGPRRISFVAGTRLMFLEHSPASWDAASFWCAATDFNIAEDRPHLPG